jgi:5'-3' exonuclease
MGIKNLNHFLTNYCNNDAVGKAHLGDFTGKTIVVDASIYLYRFVGENKLIEHLYLMVSIFLHYDIVPIFVFDGVPPPEKKQVLLERRESKRAAQEKYECLKNSLSLDTDEMEKLKKQFIHVRESDIVVTKSILDDLGIAWIAAPSEADEICAHLLHTGQAYACLSDDMDMFAYGCVRVLRHLSLVKHTVLLYDVGEILVQLKMNVQDFRQVLVLAGTDYNVDDHIETKESFRWFQIYKRETLFCETDAVPSFYAWLIQNTQYIQNIDKLNSVLNMFRPKNHINYIVNKKHSDSCHLFETLSSDGFVFPFFSNNNN